LEFAIYSIFLKAEREIFANILVILEDGPQLLVHIFSGLSLESTSKDLYHSLDLVGGIELQVGFLETDEGA
jgi:hypothetical protein